MARPRLGSGKVQTLGNSGIQQTTTFFFETWLSGLSINFMPG
jgi:hypothetical protein